MEVRTKSGANGPIVVHEDDAVRISLRGNPDDPNVFLCFTGIGAGSGGVQMEEFVGSTRLPGYFAVYITDKLRRWYNWSAREVLKILEPYLAGKQVVTIGNSMGGFGAIWMAGVLGNVRTCLAFAAQYSVHPEIMPEEKRWWKLREEIRDWRVPSLRNSFASQTRFWTFNGGRDAAHWSRFPQGENRSHFLTRDAGHDVAPVLKEAGVLSDVIKDCVDHVDPFDRIVASGIQIERITPNTDATIQRRFGGRRNAGASGAQPGPGGRQRRQAMLAAKQGTVPDSDQRKKRRNQS